MHQLGLDLIFVPTRTRLAHRAAVRAARNERRAAEELQLAFILVEPHCRERSTHVDHRLRRRDARAHAAAHFVQGRRGRVVPRRIKSEWCVDCRLVTGPVGKLGAKLGYWIRLVKSEDLARGIGTIAKAVPDFALLVLVPAKKDLLRVAFRRASYKNDNRFGLRETAQVVKMTVRPVRVMGIGVAYRLRRGRNGGDTASGLPSHFGDEPRTPVSVMLMIVVHAVFERGAQDLGNRKRDYRRSVRRAGFAVTSFACPHLQPSLDRSRTAQRAASCSTRSADCARGFCASATLAQPRIGPRPARRSRLCCWRVRTSRHRRPCCSRFRSEANGIRGRCFMRRWPEPKRSRFRE